MSCPSSLPHALSQLAHSRLLVHTFHNSAVVHYSSKGSLSCLASTLSPSFVSCPTDQAIVLQVQGFETCLVSQTHAISRNAIELLGHITFSIIAAFCHPAAAEEWTLLPFFLVLPTERPLFTRGSLLTSTWRNSRLEHTVCTGEIRTRSAFHK